jgi:hypothetical protein
MQNKIIPIFRIYIALYFFFILTKRLYELLNDEEFYSSDVNDGFLIFLLSCILYSYALYHLYRATGKKIENKIFRIVFRIISLIIGISIVLTCTSIIHKEFGFNSLINTMNNLLIIVSIIVIETSEFTKNRKKQKT